MTDPGTPRRPRATHAFTLIELLVLVTIIVVLLAMLTPALDQAVYQAELGGCGAHMTETDKGVNIYALDFKRSYPYRKVVAAGGWVYPYQVNAGPQAAGVVGAGEDDRVPLKGYVD